MALQNRIFYTTITSLVLFATACKIPEVASKTENKTVPAQYSSSTNPDTANLASSTWNQYFADAYLEALIDTALKNNQELNIVLREIEITQNEIRARKGELLPSVNVGLGAGVEKVGRYTSQGAGDATTEIKPGKEMPDPLPDITLAAYAHWEVDIWHKLRNAKKAAINRYLSSIEGKNFVTTMLVAEIANAYYELLALDKQLGIVKQNIDIQNNALQIVRLQKEAARTTELAVRKFEAEVLNTQSLQFRIQQQIVETENRINFLLGRFPQPIARSSQTFDNLVPTAVQVGLPSQLLDNRPDIKQAELQLEAAKLDVKAAKAQFYPSLDLSAALGLQSFSVSYLVKLPESLLYSLAADLVAPLINRNGIIANYSSAGARQVQAVYQFERTVLNAYMEVANQQSNIQNLQKTYDLKAKQVDALSESINISNNLFKSARADYMEVLLTQRDALESKFELVETKKQQLNALVNVYQALGGGWK